MLKIEKAERLKQLPPYLFAELDRKKEEARDRGIDVIDLGVGDPDQPTPKNIIDSLCQAAQDPRFHRYPSYSGLNSFREAVCLWYKKRINLELHPKNEVVSLIGSKEGLAHIPFAFINPGDVVLVPSPAYPVYKVATQFAGGIPYEMPLLKQNGFLPDLGAIPPAILAQAKMMFLNYPNNPTAAVATPEFFQEAVQFARDFGPVIAHDAAYTEICFKNGATSYDARGAGVATGGGNCSVGDVGYIIEAVKRSANYWELAKQTCLQNNMRLLEPFEWKLACKNAATWSLSAMTTTWEWASNFSLPMYDGSNRGVVSAVFGSGGCNYANWNWIGNNNGNENSNNFRCAR